MALSFCVIFAAGSLAQTNAFFGTEATLSYTTFQHKLSVLLQMEVPTWAVREMDQTGDGFISLLDVQNVRDLNVDWYTGEQAIAKRAASPALFEDFRSLFCCFGFDYAQPFSRMGIVGSYSIGMGYLQVMSCPLQSSTHGRVQADGLCVCVGAGVLSLYSLFAHFMNT